MTTLKPRSASVVIYQGDDLAVLAERRLTATVAQRHAQEALDAAEKAAKGVALRGGDPDPMVEAREQYDAAVKPTRDAYDAFVDEAADRAVVVEIHSIGRKRFRDLMAEHPPRTVTGEDGKDETHEDDEAHAVNVETFPEALLSFIDGDVRTIAAPDFGTRQAVRDFFDNDVADGDFGRIWNAAYFLNRAPGADPKGSRFSPAHPSSDAT